jgi:transposase InsO family protein
MLRAEGLTVNRKRVRRLMRLMGIAALGPKPRTTKPAPGHKIYPYLLRDLAIERPNQVWAADITYVPVGRGFLYLVRSSTGCRARSSPVEHHGHDVLRRCSRRGIGALRPT